MINDVIIFKFCISTFCVIVFSNVASHIDIFSCQGLVHGAHHSYDEVNGVQPHVDAVSDCTTCLVLCTVSKYFFRASSSQLKQWPKLSKYPEELVSLFITTPIQCSPLDLSSPVFIIMNALG